MHTELLNGYIINEPNTPPSSLGNLSSPIEQQLAPTESTDHETNLKNEDQDKNNEKMYGVIVDCGSSGSRVHIFQWFASRTDKRVVGLIESVVGPDGKPVLKQIKRGLSKVKTENEAVEYVKPLIEFIIEKIPDEKKNGEDKKKVEDKLKKTSVYFLATAGMRLVESTAQLKTMNSILDFLKREYGIISAKSRIITGWEEGLFQWVTVKTLTRQFNEKDFGMGSKVDGDYDGIIEMGGASLQVAFSATQKIIDLLHTRVNFQETSVKDALASRIVQTQDKKSDVKVLAMSFLGLGANSIRQLSLDMLIVESLKEAAEDLKDDVGEDTAIRALKSLFKKRPFPISDPCTVQGVRYHVYRPESVFDLNFFDNKYKTNEIPEDEVNDDSPSNKGKIKILVDGQGNDVECEKHLHNLIDKIKDEALFCKPDTSCASKLLRELFVPFDQMKFAAIGNFFYPLQLILQPKEEKLDPQNFSTPLNFVHALLKAREFCKKDFQTLMKEYPKANDYDKDRIKNQCFRSLWGLTFLEYGLRLQPFESTQVTILNKIQQKPIEWTLGAIVSNYANMEQEVGSSDPYYELPGTIDIPEESMDG